jgi:hypothetical protein
MTNALGIASVTALLKHLLENGMAQRHVSAKIGGQAPVTALPPDRITVGTDEQPQLNLFLYQMTPNTGRHQARPDGRGGERSFLALDLHYLVTAYCASDFQAEILLGYAFQLLSRATIGREELGLALASLSSDRDGRGVAPPAAALAESNLADQVTSLSITPQARYRPSSAYKVSLIYI